LVLEPTIAGKIEKLRIYLDDPRTESLIKRNAGSVQLKGHGLA